MILLNNNYESILQNFKFIDLFAGIGGFRISLESFGARCVFSSEINKAAIQTYQANFGELPSGDITKIDENLIPDHDILCAGFPCQPFSISGKQEGFSDTRGTLFFDVIRIAKAKKPSIIFLENVNNLVTHNKGGTINKMISDLKNLDYNVDFKILNSADFYTPQSRKRVYILAIKKDKYNQKIIFPNPLHKYKNVSDILEKNVNEKYNIKNNEFKINNNHALKKNIVQKNKPSRLGILGKGGQGERIYDISTVGISLSAEGGGPGAKTGIYYIDQKIRKLTPREAARMQGFPEHFKIVVSDNQAWKQFGNSVSINVLQYIIKELIDQKVFKDWK